MQLQYPRAFPRFLAAKLELKHYSVLIPSAVIKGAGHRPMRDPTELLRWIVWAQLGPVGPKAISPDILMITNHI